MLEYLKQITKAHSYYMSVISGIVSGMVYAPYFMCFLWVSISIPITALYFTINYRKAFSIGYLFGLGHFITSLSWIASGLLSFEHQFLWAIPICLIIIPVILAIFIGITFLISYPFKNSNFFIVIFSIIWICFEYLRSFIFTGFPWNLAGYSLFFSNNLIQIIFLLGIYGLSFVVIYIFSNFANLLIGNIKLFRINLIISLGIIVSTIIYGCIILHNNPTKFLDSKLRIVQTSIPQITRWEPEKLFNNLDTYIKLSNIKANFQPDLIIWPESSITAPINYNAIQRYILDKVSIPNSHLLAGCMYDEVSESEIKRFVSLVAMNTYHKKIKFIYSKKHLVPFGEYIPWENILPLKKITHGDINFSQGTTKEIFDINGLKIRPLICYEVIFPDELNITNTNTDLIINITNDAWYRDIVGLHQHFHMARARAIEHRIPLVRASTSGISAVIDPLGRIIKSSKINDIITIDSYIPKKHYFTVYYNQYINLFLLLIMIFLIEYCLLFYKN